MDAGLLYRESGMAVLFMSCEVSPNERIQNTVQTVQPKASLLKILNGFNVVIAIFSRVSFISHHHLPKGFVDISQQFLICFGEAGKLL